MRLLAIIALLAAAVPCAAANVQIDCRARGQTWEGWGATDLCAFDGTANEAEAGPPGEIPAWGRQAVMRLYYHDLGMTRVRFAPTGYEPKNDNDDPFKLNAAAFDWKGRKVRPWMALDPYCDDHLVIGRKFRSAAEPYTFYTAMNCPEQWMSKTPDSPNWYWAQGGRLNPTMVEEYAEHALAGVQHVKQAYRCEMPYWSLFNEPSNTARPTKETTLALVLATGRRFKSHGLKTKLVICDDVTPESSAATIEFVLADKEARGYIGAVSYHRYCGDFVLEQVRPMLKKIERGELLVSKPVSFHQSAAKYGKSVWLSEQCSYGDDGITFFDAGRARANHICDEINNAGVNAFDFMLCYFVERGRPGNEECPIFLRFADGKYVGAELNPIGHWFRHFTRFIRPGAVRVGAASDDKLVKVVAFEHRRNKTLIVVVVNNHPEDAEVTVKLAGANAGKVTDRSCTSPGKLGEELPALPVRDGRITDRLPATSVTTYVLRPS